MLEQYFLYLCVTALIARAADRSALSVGASVYDVRQGKAAQGDVQGASRPVTFSVVVVARNHEETIKACIESIRTALPTAGNKVLVMDNASIDNTARIVRKMVRQKGSTVALQLVRTHEQQPFQDVKGAAEKYVDGDVVVVLSGQNICRADMFTELATAFTRRKANKVMLNEQVLPFPSFLATLERLDSLGQSQVRKTLSIVGQRNLRTGGHATACTKNVFSFNRGDIDTMPAIYASRAKVLRPPNLNAGKLLWPQVQVSGQWGAALWHIIEPVMVTYFTYLAYSGRNTSLLLLSFGVYAIWAIQAVLSEATHARAGDRLQLILLLPPIYLLLYVRSIARLVVITKLSADMSMKRFTEMVRGDIRVYLSRPWHAPGY